MNRDQKDISIDIPGKNGSKRELFSAQQDAEYNALRRQKERFGLAFGVMAGLAFALAVWGLDGYQLAQAHASLPWLKFLVGGAFCAGLGGFVGYLAEKIGNALVTFLAWVATGALFAWFNSHLSFEIQSALVSALHPEFRGFELYPYSPNVDRRMVVIYIVVVLLSALVGALQNNLVESARAAAFPVIRWLALAVCVPLMLLAGSAADNVNEPLRVALVGVNQVIENALRAEETPVDKRTAAEQRLRAVASVQHLLHRPRRLIVGSYNVQNLDSFGIYIDFDGIWATCSVMIDSPSNCKPSDDLYPVYLACLLRGETPEACRATVTGPAQAWLDEHAGDLGQAPLAQVSVQRGDVTWVDVLGEDQNLYRCRFSGIQFSAVLQGCTFVSQNGSPLAFRPTATPTPVRPTRTPGTTPSVTPIDASAEPTSPVSTNTLAPQETDTPPAPTVPSAEVFETLQGVSQAQAMLAEDRADLEDLSNLARYFIAVDIDYLGQSFSARSRLVYTNTETVALDSLYFRLLPNGGRSYGDGFVAVSRAAQAGAPLDTSLSLDDSVLELKLAEPLEPGERTEIEMDFSGTVPGVGGSGYGIFSYNRGVLTLASWYPQLAVYDEDGWNLDPVSSIGDSVYADMAFYAVEMTASRNLVTAATGVEVDRQSLGDVDRVRFASGPVREFFLALSDQFGVESKMVGGVKVNSYYLPGHVAAGKMALGYAASSVEHFNQLFGRYPYKELDVVEAPMTYAAGVEFPGIFLITDSLYETMRQPFFTYVVAHEVGHQWWYNLVGNDVFDDPWLDEGLTTYTGALYWEEMRGQRAYQQSIDSFQAEYDRILQNEQDEHITQSLAFFESLDNPGVYGTVVYEKGALFFHYLRQEIGRSAFFKAIRAYYQAHKYAIARPEDLLSAFEDAAGRALDDFYEEWLYSKK